MTSLLPPVGLALLLASCTTSDHLSAPRIPGPASSVTRSEAITIVDTYAKTKWLAEARHSFHGKDSQNITVQTPDAHQGGGFWKIDHFNFGMPYKWGGFDTPQSFQAGLERGKFAGDVSSRYKRKLLGAAVSKEAIGIDCSGLISRAWRLDRPYSTREIPDLCSRLDSWDELKPGDVLNRFNGHVVMFSDWKQRGVAMYGYEAGPFSGWRTSKSLLRIDYLKALGYVALRYRNMRDDPSPRPDPTPRSDPSPRPDPTPRSDPSPRPDPTPRSGPSPAPTQGLNEEAETPEPDRSLKNRRYLFKLKR